MPRNDVGDIVPEEEMEWEWGNVKDIYGLGDFGELPEIDGRDPYEVVSSDENDDKTSPWDTPFPDDPYVVTYEDKGYNQEYPIGPITQVTPASNTSSTPPVGPIWPWPSGGSGTSTGSTTPAPVPGSPAPAGVPNTDTSNNSGAVFPVPGNPTSPTPNMPSGTIGSIPTQTPGTDTTNDTGAKPPVIPIPQTGGGTVDIPDWAKIGGAAASAIGGAININNQFDFLKNSADDQIKANRNAAVDSGVMQNPDFFNPYGSQTTQGGYIDPATGQIVRPKVTQALTPQQQALFDREQGIKQDLGDLTQTQVGRVGNQFNTPFSTAGMIDRFRPNGEGLFDYQGIDLNNLSARNTMPGVTGRNAITDAIIQREQPRFQREEDRMKNDLLVRGFNPGTEGYTEQLDEFGRAKNDFNLAAQAAGAQEQSRLFGLESSLRNQQLNEQEALRRGNAANRGQQVDERLDFGGFASDERNRELQEALALRTLPLNELNALRSGNQFNMPAFQQYQGSGVGAPDYISQGIAQSNVAGDVANQFFDLSKGALNAWGWGNPVNRSP